MSGRGGGRSAVGGGWGRPGLGAGALGAYLSEARALRGRWGHRPMSRRMLFVKLCLVLRLSFSFSPFSGSTHIQDSRHEHSQDQHTSSSSLNAQRSSTLLGQTVSDSRRSCTLSYSPSLTSTLTLISLKFYRGNVALSSRSSAFCLCTVPLQTRHTYLSGLCSLRRISQESWVRSP